MKNFTFSINEKVVKKLNLIAPLYQTEDLITIKLGKYYLKFGKNILKETK